MKKEIKQYLKTEEKSLKDSEGLKKLIKVKRHPNF